MDRYYFVKLLKSYYDEHFDNLIGHFLLKTDFKTDGIITLPLAPERQPYKIPNDEVEEICIKNKAKMNVKGEPVTLYATEITEKLYNLLEGDRNARNQAL